MAHARVPIAVDPYLGAFKPNPSEHERVQAARSAALDRFAARGLPSAREEAWRLIDPRPLSATMFAPNTGGVVDAGALAALVEAHAIEGTARIVLVNGRVNGALSRVDAAPGLAVASIAALLREQDGDALLAVGDHGALVDLNTAFAQDGVRIEIADDATLAAPIHVIHISCGSHPHSIHTRVAVAIGAGARATVIESFVGLAGGECWANGVTRLSLGAEAAVEHIILRRDPEQVLATLDVSADVAAGADHRIVAVNAGSRLSRIDAQVRLVGERARTRFTGVSLVSGRRQSAIATTIRHAAPNCETHELIKSVIDDQAHAAFMGKIIVDRVAQRTNAYQLSQALLLSEGARSNAKPELEIHADDVKCTHGSTSGDLDEQALFYLRSRGMPEALARAALIEGFVVEALDAITSEAGRAAAEAHVDDWLGRFRAKAEADARGRA